MPLVPSKLTNPNWPGPRSGGGPDCPVEQVFNATPTGNGGFSAGAEALSEPVWSVLQTLQPLLLRCLNTDGWHRKVALFTHTVSDCKLRVSHSHPVAFWDSELPARRWAISAHSLVVWDSWKPGTWAQLSFLFLLSCLVKWECVWRWGITYLVQVRVQGWNRTGGAWPCLCVWPLTAHPGDRVKPFPTVSPLHTGVLQDPGRTHCFSQKAPGLGNVCI